MNLINTFSEIKFYFLKSYNFGIFLSILNQNNNRKSIGTKDE